nr:MAG TPA: hypothetical protein [Bacteriophage sp.]
MNWCLCNCHCANLCSIVKIIRLLRISPRYKNKVWKLSGDLPERLFI